VTASTWPWLHARASSPLRAGGHGRHRGGVVSVAQLAVTKLTRDAQPPREHIPLSSTHRSRILFPAGTESDASGVLSCTIEVSDVDLLEYAAVSERDPHDSAGRSYWTHSNRDIQENLLSKYVLHHNQCG